MSKRLIYIAKITEPPMERGAYYKNKRFQNRRDCIYQWRKNRKLTWRQGSLFHKNGAEAATDIGFPPNYFKAVVLLSRNFRYFGRAATLDYARKFSEIKKAIEDLGRGYRVKHQPSLGRELMKLKRAMWRKYQKMRVGRPTSVDADTRCNLMASKLVKIR